MSNKLNAVMIALMVFVPAVCAVEQTGKINTEMDTVLVTVQGTPITKNDLYVRTVQQYPGQVQDALDRMVNEIIVFKEAESRKVSVSEAEIAKKADELGITGAMNPAAKDLIKASLLADKMITAELQIKITPDDVKSFFDSNRAVLGEPEQFKLRQIFVLSENEARDIVLSLNAGADFAKLAKAKSLDNTSKDKGGDIGFLSRGMILPEIEKAVFGMKPGEISAPIQSASGWHVIKVEAVTPAKEAKFDAKMKKQLETALLNYRIQQALPAWLENLRKKAVIK